MAPPLTPAQEPFDTSATSKGKRKLSPRLLIPLGLLLTGIGVFTSYVITSRSAANTIRVTGRIEGYQTDIGAKVAGRITSVAVREGDTVREKQVIVQLDDAEIQAQLKGASARVDAMQKQEEQARLQVSFLHSQIEENQISLKQAVEDAKGRILQAESSVASSQAQLSQAIANVEQAKSELKLAQMNRDRYIKLVKQGAITRQLFDQAQANLESALANLKSRQAAVTSYQKLVNSAQGQLTQAQSVGYNSSIRNVQLNASKTQLAQTQLKLSTAQADVLNAKAAVEEIKAKIANLTVTSPINGVVVSRNVEPGVVVTTGKTLLTLIDPNTVYLRAFIPQGIIGKVRVGQPAKIFLDSAIKQPLAAKIAAIDTQASFTPENIYFQQDRVKQVFGVKITIDNPAGFAKPGMPADAEIDLTAN
ncbi:HlyD family secretion protein [Calothrix sp. FACHB-1219]|uniref:HlyD family secretion protein n=1 Tax=unclassified Calothrix TaxID=2619626 RepID=UPI0016846523|nr:MULTISPECIES: HlyD family efflux transporter periplasmic adaptor subunit [unclassified Calothrix]MBD2207734.1 HlyD family secretion protein [Calothrix sp. FACHB-168]MBD2219203.1 HlyD family secretion protein [Calothrix sp. FACHB-1219]